MKIISIKSTGIEFTDAVRVAINKKLLALEKFTEKMRPVAELMIEVGKPSQHHRKGDVFYAEATLCVPNAVLRAESTAETLYAAIDAVRDDLLRQIKKHKGKLRTSQKKGGRKAKYGVS